MILSFLAAQYGTISDIEILWTLIAGSGLIFSLYNIREALRDRRAIVESNIGNGRKKIAGHALRNEAARALIQVIFLVIGILTMTYADPATINPDQPWNLTLISIVFRWGLIFSAILISLKSFWSFQLRRELRKDALLLPLTGTAVAEVTGQVTVKENGGDNVLTATLEGPIENQEA